jgi:hypothetical protein
MIWSYDEAKPIFQSSGLRTKYIHILKIKYNVQSNLVIPVITNSLGPGKFVRYNRDALLWCKFLKHQILIKMFAQS